MPRYPLPVGKKKFKKRRSEHSSSRTNILRTSFKKSYCEFFLFTNLAFFISLITIFCVVVALHGQFHKLGRKLGEEAQDFEKMKDDSIFLASCRYKHTPTYNITQCGSHRRPDDSYIRVKSLKRIQTIYTEHFEKPPVCFDVAEQISCHESLSSKPNIDFRSEISECKYDFLRLNQSKQMVYAPAIDQATLETLEGQQLLASELIVICPRCSRMTEPARFLDDKDGKCFVKVRTEEHGWPADFELCDSVQYTEENLTDCQDLVFEKIDQESYTNNLEILSTQSTTTTPISVQFFATESSNVHFVNKD